MTHTHYFGSSSKDLDRFFVGYDKLFDQLRRFENESKSVPNYPPYNVIKTADNVYVIEIAVAGFSEKDLEITQEENKLVVTGNTGEDASDYVYKGIANRAFTRVFNIEDNIKVQDAKLSNGMLQVVLERIVPEHKKPKTIKINSTETLEVSQRELLTETSHN